MRSPFSRRAADSVLAGSGGGPEPRDSAGPEIEKTDAEWQAELTPAQYRVLRGKGTERPFTGQLLDVKADGSYHCAGCGATLFSSDTKFDSGTGWPSFTDPAVSANVALHEDRTLFLRRTEVTCARCGGHLGHVFNDGPRGKQRYCINSVSLEFEPDPGDAAGSQP